MTLDAQVYSMMVEHDRAVPMIEQIDQTTDALLDHDRDQGTLSLRLIEQIIVKQISLMI